MSVVKVDARYARAKIELVQLGKLYREKGQLLEDYGIMMELQGFDRESFIVKEELVNLARV